MSDLLDTTPATSKRRGKPLPKVVAAKLRKGTTAKPRKAVAPRGEVRPGRLPAARTVRIREKILENLKGKRNGVPNAELAGELKISAGECLKLAQLLIKEGHVVALKKDGSVILKRA